MANTRAHYLACLLLLAGSLVLAVACARQVLPTAPTQQPVVSAVRPIAAPKPEAALEVLIPWPEADRQLAYLYGGGSKVSAVEVFLYDAYSNYQSALIVRNTAAGGSYSGTASVVFDNVPSGPAMVTVHTLMRNLLVTDLVADSASSTSYEVDGVRVVNTISGDQSSQFLVFRSADLLGQTPNGSPMAFLNPSRAFVSRDGRNEMTDGALSGFAGHGMGFGTATVPEKGIVKVAVSVSQPPSFGAQYSSTFTAGSTMSLNAANVQPGDVLLATDSVLDPRVDVIDLLRVRNATYAIQIGQGSISFTETRTLPKRNLYLLRGTAISLVGLAETQPPTAVVIPAIFDASQSQVYAYSRFLGAGYSDTITVSLRDRYGNVITSLAGENNYVSMSGMVEPTAVSTGTFLVPGVTYGSISPFTADATAGVWKAVFTQGKIAATTTGAQPAGLTGSGGLGTIGELTQFFLPYSMLAIGSTGSVHVKVQQGSQTLVQLFARPDLATASLFAQRTLSAAENGASASLEIPNLDVGTNSIVATGAIAAGDTGTIFTYSESTASLGARKMGDTDTLRIRITCPTCLASSSIDVRPAVYTWY